MSYRSIVLELNMQLITRGVRSPAHSGSCMQGWPHDPSLHVLLQDTGNTSKNPSTWTLHNSYTNKHSLLALLGARNQHTLSKLVLLRFQPSHSASSVTHKDNVLAFPCPGQPTCTMIASAPPCTMIASEPPCSPQAAAKPRYTVQPCQD